MENRLNGETRLSGPQIAVYIDFENVATSAEANLGEFDVTAVMDLLRTRGRLLIKRAYGDWGRFHRYRRAMLENGVDLFQLYSVGIQQKNRADVRLAIDAIETVFTRPNIDVYTVISGDSDFTELVHKLRDHGKYTIGIGLHAATSDLLRRACDEFIFYETLVTEGMEDIADELQLPDPRDLLRRALIAAEQKGETPIFAGRLKQMMLGLDSSFNEANYGYQQFRAFLEAHADLVNIQEQGLQLYISLKKPETEPARGPAAESARLIDHAVETSLAAPPPPAYKPAFELGQRYRSFLREVNLRVVEPNTRSQALADFLAVLQAQPGPCPVEHRRRSAEGSLRRGKRADAEDRGAGCGAAAGRQRGVDVRRRPAFKPGADPAGCGSDASKSWRGRATRPTSGGWWRAACRSTPISWRRYCTGRTPIRPQWPPCVMGWSTAG